jgi:hypothetical protein
MKICKKCNIEKPLDEFYKNSGGKDGKHSKCKLCLCIVSKIWSQNNPEKVKNTIRKWQKNNPDKVNTVNSNWRKNNPEKAKEADLKKNFGITLAQYNEMCKKQNHKCAICNQPETSLATNGKVKALSVDHDHKNGKIRGLLCKACNCAIGLLKDNNELLIKAAYYVTSGGI